MNRQPNFLVFMTDQQNGMTQPPNNMAFMPNLQRLASQGVSFSQAYCTSPHCCPSRASFFSGLYPSEHGVWNHVDGANTLSSGLYDQVRLFSEDLRDQGYQMYYSGKWHVSAEEGPAQRGFELIDPQQHPQGRYQRRENMPDDSEWRYYGPDKPMSESGRPRRDGEIKRPFFPEYIHYGVSDNPFNDGTVVKKAEEKLQELDDTTPFFMYVGTLGPHEPHRVPQKFLDLYDPADIELPVSFDDQMQDKPGFYRRTRDRFAQLTEREQKEAIRHYLAFCTYEDSLLGQLLDTLEERQLLENTIVIYLSDHGDYLGTHGLWGKGLPAFREAYHICSVIGYGNLKNRGKVVDAFISLTDYAPTFLELAGVKAERKMSGRSLAGFLYGEDPLDWRQEAFTQTNGNEMYGIQRSVFNQDYKYVFNGFDYDELYDLKKDPHEMRNIIKQEGSDVIVRQMIRKLWQFAHDHQDNIVNPYIMTALADYGPNIIYS